MRDVQYPIDRLPPQNVEAEEQVLGSILIDPEATDRAACVLEGDDFYRDRNRSVFAAALALRKRGEPVDVGTLSDQLKRTGRYDEIGGLPYLSHLVGVVPTAFHVERYAQIVKRTAVKRRLISAAGRIAEVAYDETLDVDATLEKASQLLAGVAGSAPAKDTYTPEEQFDLLTSMLDRLKAGGPLGIPSRFHNLTRYTGGYQPGCLYVVGAITKMGKTAWLASEARHMRSLGLRVHFASAEMTVMELVKRSAAVLLGRSWLEIAQKGIDPRVDAERLLSLPELVPHVYDGSGMSVDRIRTRIAQMKAKGGCDVVFADYVQRLQTEKSRDDRYREVDTIAMGLKSLAREMNVPVIVAAQFNSKTVQARPLLDRVPVFTDFRETGGIAQEADVAMGLHRWSKYTDLAVVRDENGSDVLDEHTPGDPTEAWLYILANRHGPEAKRVKLRWLAETCSYESPADAEGRAE